MHGEPEPYFPLHNADRVNAETKLNLTGAGGEVPNMRDHLLNLDAILDRRAASIEAELREIALVRKQIKIHLTPSATGAIVPRPPGPSGASLGQMI